MLVNISRWIIGGYWLGNRLSAHIPFPGGASKRIIAFDKTRHPAANGMRRDGLIVSDRDVVISSLAVLAIRSPEFYSREMGEVLEDGKQS